MNRLLSTAALALALSTPIAFAQAPAQHQHVANPHKAALRIGHQLGLSDDQIAKLEPILADRQQKVQAVRADASLTDAQRKQQLKAVHQNERMQLGTVLTPDQMKQLKAMRHAHARAAAAPAV